MGTKVRSRSLTEPRRTVRDVTLEFEEEGEFVTDAYAVRYRSLSSKLLRELASADDTDEVTDENRNVVAEQLSQLVIEIDGVVDDNDKPAKLLGNYDFFDSLSLTNLRSINTAIRDDINPPKPQPAT